jgi:hypothetical protein
MNDSIKYDHQLTPAALRLVADVEQRQRRATAKGRLMRAAAKVTVHPAPPKKEAAPLTPVKAERLGLLREAGMRIQAKQEARKP